MPLADLLSKQRKNGGGATKTPSGAGVANSLNAKTALVASPPPKQNVQTCRGIFVDYMDIYFQAKLSAYIKYMSISDGSIYKVGCVGEFMKLFAKSRLCDGVQCRS